MKRRHLLVKTLAPLRRRGPAAGLASLAGLCAVAAHAQESGGSRSLEIVPSITVTQTFTDNVLQNDADKRHDAITELRPGVRISSNSGRVQGQLDYSLNGVVHARDGGLNEVQHSLAANLRAEAIERFAFIDASASIDRQLISPLGLRSSEAGLVNNNLTEVRNLYVSPYVRGVLMGSMSYEARLNESITRSNSTDSGDSNSFGVTARLSSATAGTRLGWSIDYTKQKVEFSAGRDSETERANAALIFSVTPDFSVTGRVGREINTFTSVDRQSANTTGWGLHWTPTERTDLSVDRDRRYFGDSYSVRFTHRMPSSVWNFSSSKSVTGDQPNASNVSGSTVSVYDLLFQQFASLSPDPVQREALVNAFLRQYGIDRSALAFIGFVTSAATVERRDELSLALIGLRGTLIFSLFQSDVRRLDPVVQVPDDLSNGNQVSQRGLNTNFSYRLTPESALNVGLTWQRTSATVTAQSTTLRTLSATWSNRLGARTNVSAGARRTSFTSPAQPYTENAVFAAVTYAF